jgi:hypothetical protein
MEYSIGDILVGEGALEERRNYIVTKTTPKTVFFSPIRGGKVLANCAYKSRIDQEGKLRIDVTPYRSIYLRKA